MAGINKVILLGFVGKEPDLRRLDNNIAELSFPFATSELITQHGITREVTEWHNIIMWRGIAESAFKILKKGKLVHIEGKLRTRAFQDRSGIKKYTTEVMADYFNLVGDSPELAEDAADENIKYLAAVQARVI